MPESAAAAATQAYPAGNTALLADVRRFVAAASRPYLEQPSIHDLVLAVTEACAQRDQVQRHRRDPGHRRSQRHLRGDHRGG